MQKYCLVLFGTLNTEWKWKWIMNVYRQDCSKFENLEKWPCCCCWISIRPWSPLELLTELIRWSYTNTIMPYGLKPENVLCANTIALALAKRLVGSTKHENHQNYVQQWIKITSSKHHARLLCTATFDCSSHTTQPNLSLRHWRKKTISRMCVYYITFVICHSILIVVVWRGVFLIQKNTEIQMLSFF